MGNQALNVAKFAVGGVNWSHYLIADGGKVLDPLDNLISQGARGMYNAVFTTWIGPALLILAVSAVRAGDARRPGPAGAARGVRGRGARRRVRRLPRADRLGEGRRSAAARRRHRACRRGSSGQVGLGDRDTLPTVLVDQVVYQNWLRGEFGAPDVPQAEQFGRNLLRAQTFTKAEVAEGRATARARRAEEERLRHDRGSGRRPLPLPPGQVRQPDRRRGARGRRGRRASRCSSSCPRSWCWSRCSSSGCWS